MGANRAQSLSEAIEDYERFRRSMDIAKTTLRAQRVTLRRFLEVNGNIWVHSITDLHVTRFFEVASKTKQPQSLRNDHDILNSFFEWAKRTKRLGFDADPMYGRRKPKSPKRERNRIAVSKFPALLDAAGARCERDRAAVALLLYTLARDGEIADLRIRDLELESGYLIMRIHKTQQEDRVPISAELDAELRTWLTYYTDRVGPLQPHYYLVPARAVRGIRDENGDYYGTNEELHLRPENRVRALHTIVKPALEAIGFPTVDADGRPMGEGSHTIRRSGARALFDQLVDDGYDQSLRLVQSLLHHASIRTTEHYIGITADRRTRDEVLRGKRMYDIGDNVVQLRRAEEA